MNIFFRILLFIVAALFATISGNIYRDINNLQPSPAASAQLGWIIGFIIFILIPSKNKTNDLRKFSADHRMLTGAVLIGIAVVIYAPRANDNQSINKKTNALEQQKKITQAENKNYQHLPKEEAEYQKAVDALEIKYPELNPKSNQFNQESYDFLVGRFQYYLAKYPVKNTALDLALEDYRTALNASKKPSLR